MKPSPKNTSNHHALALATLSLTGFVLYAYVLNHANYFFQDDKVTILANSPLYGLSWHEIWTAFRTRIVVGLSFALNYFLSQTEPYGYRLLNISIHIANAFCVYLLAGNIFSRIAADTRVNRPHLVGLFCALLFLSHPLQTEPVNYLNQRYVLLASFFYLATLIGYHRARQSTKPQRFILPLVTTVLAMFCKEFAVTLPLMLVLYEFTFFSKAADDRRKKFLILLPFLLTITIIPMTLLTTSAQNIGTARIASTAPSTGAEGIHIDISRADNCTLSRSEYLLTEFRVIFTYIRLFFIPVNQNVDYDYPIAYSLWDPWTLSAFLSLLALAVAACVNYKRDRLFSFCIFWIFLTLSVESSFIPIGHVIAEYRFYLPSVGMCLLTSAGLSRALKTQKNFAVAAGLIIIILSVLTLQRNYVWSDEVRISQDILSKARKISTVNNVGAALFEKKQYAEAIPYFKAALTIPPAHQIPNYVRTYNDVYSNLCMSYTKLKQWDEAFQYCSTLTKLDPSTAENFHYLAYVYFKMGRYDDGLECYRRLLLLDPSDTNAFRYVRAISVYFQKTGDQSAVREHADVLRQYGFPKWADFLLSPPPPTGTAEK